MILNYQKKGVAAVLLRVSISASTLVIVANKKVRAMTFYLVII